MPVEKPRRFLRSIALRAALFFNADGRCQSCGLVLSEDWHADHVTPWHISHGTNIFDMQALCRECNLQKGGRLVTTGLEGFKPDKLRIGQQRAVSTILECVTAGQTHTSIVLPTRYGKSDVIRVAGAMLLKNRVTTRCLILEPATYLVNQIMNPDKMAEAIRDYGLPFTAKELSVYPMLGSFRFQSLIADYAPFLAMTIQMALVNTNNNILQHLIEYDTTRGNGPPIVFIDEAHTGSSANKWGECTKALSEAGAFLVLLTATPFRTDEQAVYGFQYDPVRMDPITRYQADGELVHKYEGYKIAHKLRADFEYPFDKAWAEEPLPICVIQHRTFDVKMGEVADEDSSELLGTRLLSELTETEVRRWIGRVVRSQVVVERGVETFLDELLTLRKDAPKSKGIVFVGNDADEDYHNEHAVKVKTAIERMAKNLRVEIATNTIDGGNLAAQSRINSFATDRGADILIVKQMGGIGLDVPQLKVGLDLSPVRTATASIQRMMRIGTIWPEPESGSGPMFIARWVTPADTRSVRLFRVTVHDQGGDANTIDVEYVASFLRKRRGEAPPPGPTYLPLAGLEGDTLADTEGNTAPSTKLPWIKHVKDRFKRIAYVLSDPQIADIQDLARDYDGGPRPQPEARTGEGEGVVNIPATKKRMQDSINDFIRRVTHLLHPRAGKAFGDHFREYMTDLKIKRCGLPYKKLQDYSMAELEKIREEAEKWFNNLQSQRS